MNLDILIYILIYSPKDLSSILISPLLTCPSNENGRDEFPIKSKNLSSFTSLTETITLDGDSPNKKHPL